MILANFILRPLYYAIRVSIYLLIAFELALVVAGTVADQLGDPGRYSVAPVTWVIIVVSILLFVLFRIKGPRQYESTALVTIVLMANLIALLIAESDPDGFLTVLGMVLVPIAVTALAEYLGLNPDRTNPPADDTKPDPETAPSAESPD